MTGAGGDSGKPRVRGSQLSKEGQRQLSVSEATAAKAAAHKLARYGDANTTHPKREPKPEPKVESEPKTESEFESEFKRN